MYKHKKLPNSMSVTNLWFSKEVITYSFSNKCLKDRVSRKIQDNLCLIPPCLSEFFLISPVSESFTELLSMELISIEVDDASNGVGSSPK